MKGQKNILLVEDGEMAGKITERILKTIKIDELNFNVRWERNPCAAMEVIGDTDKKIDLVVTDHLMPGISGVEIVGAVLEKRPGVPIVGVSGTVGDFRDKLETSFEGRCNVIIIETEEQFRYSPGRDIILLPKPFVIDKVRFMLSCIFH